MKTISLQKFLNDANAIIQKQKYEIKGRELEVSFTTSIVHHGEKVPNSKPEPGFYINYSNRPELFNTDYKHVSVNASSHDYNNCLFRFEEEIKKAKGIVAKKAKPVELVTIQ